MKSIIILATLIILSGCSSAPYQQRNDGVYGYREFIVADHLYYLEYYDTHIWSVSDGKEKWKKKASELCPQGAYEVISYNERTAYLSNYNSLTFYGSIPIVSNETLSSAVSEGFVKCSVSKLTTAEIKEIMDHDRFCPDCIPPKKT